MTTTTSLHALYLRMETTAAGYLTAHKALRTLDQHKAGLSLLVAAQPRRIDYRAAWRKAVADHAEAVDRANLAYQQWQDAGHAYDTLWTATRGRATGTVAPIFAQAA
ncbi:hypothetical protein [Kutzneria chonburiensis]|uniref:Uncharacterized protein n=1 Tax=Kutzneria chonburiensis TaxID=1483604 RepID=A0ABV6MKJ9_9PSEU|nr:hypothetical protein [Kutzneria chonburiensis]